MDSKILKSDIESRLIDSVLENGLRKTDIYKDLECFCSDNPPNNNFERKIRGYVFNQNSDLILKSFSYPYVYKFDEEKDNDNNLIEDENNVYDHKFIGDLNKYQITYLKEGTVIRVFYYEGEWFCSTHRKLNAFKSKWGKISFGEIFENNIKLKTGKSLNEFYNSLDKNIKYFFLVGTIETTRVVSPTYSDIFLLNTMDSGNNIIFCEEFKDWYQEPLKVNSFDKVINIVNNLQYPFEKGCGLYLFSEEKSFKVINKDYEKFASLRNNLPSIPFAYLHNVFDPEKNKQFRDLYPSFKEEFDFYDEEINKISIDIKNKYFRKYAKKEDFVLNKQEYIIIRTLHKIFQETKKPITTENVIQVFKELPISNLNKIIASRKIQKKLLEKINQKY